MEFGCRGLVIISFFCFLLLTKKQFVFFAVVRDNLAYYCCPVHRFRWAGHSSRGRVQYGLLILHSNDRNHSYT